MAVVFLDTETTGTERGRRAWEIAMIRRERDGSEQEITIFVATEDLDLANANPAALSVGRFEQRHPEFGWPLRPGQCCLRESEAAQLVKQWTAAALVFGVNPSFDTVCLDTMLGRHGLKPDWYYVPQDIVGIAYGFVLKTNGSPPRGSEDLSLACGVDLPNQAERHTALGDAHWVRRWYDHLHAQGCEVA